MTGQRKRGFAAMSPEKQRLIAQKGGRAAHEKGTAHEFSREEAQVAGRRGGKVVSADRAHMAAIGRKGGKSAAREAREKAGQSGHAEQPVRPLQSQDGERDAVTRAPTGHGATALIRNDHRKVEGLFHRYETAGDRIEQKDYLARQICEELDAHTRIEEEIFYPAVRAGGGGEEQGLVEEGFREHRRVKDLIARLRGMSADDVTYDQVVRELKDCVEHHVQEEEGEILPRAEAELGDELERLGARMEQRKHQVMETDQAA